jgi:hypothetical protein
MRLAKNDDMIRALNETRINTAMGLDSRCRDGYGCRWVSDEALNNSELANRPRGSCEACSQLAASFLSTIHRFEPRRIVANPQSTVVGPRLAEWLPHVFIVLGGCAVATGALTVTLAATSFRAHGRGPAIGAAIGGAASIGLMTAVNFATGPDFKWFLGIALLWTCSLGLFWLKISRSSA